MLFGQKLGLEKVTPGIRRDRIARMSVLDAKNQTSLKKNALPPVVTKSVMEKVSESNF